MKEGKRILTRSLALEVPTLKVSGHPLVADKITKLREKQRSPEVFRMLVSQITALLLYEATSDLQVVATVVHTPLSACTGWKLGQQVGLVPVLRAGLGMVSSALEHIPNAQVWALGLYRDEGTFQPVSYYNKMPTEPTADIYIVLDPMLATGGSACDAVKAVKGYGKPVMFVGLIAAPEGVLRLAEEHPDVPIHVGALDDHLNADRYIVPGLGDAGDRYFNT